MKHITALFLLAATSLFAQDSGFSFYSGQLLFKPLTANTFEPRVGFIWRLNNNKLRLDIGNSIDIIQYQFQDKSKLLTIGSDFFTYTQLKGEANFYFPVDAVDYLFGVNVNYKDTIQQGTISLRLRLSHISAHFVDGHYDKAAAMWKDGMAPRVYSREFFDLAIAFEPTNSMRYYAGSIYVWHVVPATLPKFLFYSGTELHHQFYSSLNGYIAYQFTATGLRPRHEIQAGGKIGSWAGKGTKIFFIYYFGNSIHGEYYDRKDEYSGVGFNVDF